MEGFYVEYYPLHVLCTYPTECPGGHSVGDEGDQK